MSSANNKFISNEAVVPIVKSELFVGHEDVRYAIGVFSTKSVLEYKPGSLEQGILILRGNTYVDQTNMLDAKVKDIDGTEMDVDDDRSIHFAVFENHNVDELDVKIPAYMRSIEITDDRVLPIQKFFPEVKVPLDSAEGSRFIVKHDDPRQAKELMIAMLAIGLNDAWNRNVKNYYGVVEPIFERYLNIITRKNANRVADPKMIPEYNDVNVGIIIDYDKLRENSFGENITKNMKESGNGFKYWGKK